MNIEHLKLFVRIASLHNISQAGKELGLSPAVASAHMSRLEESLGVRLLHRSTRRISLTEEGEVFLPHAVDLLECVATARASIGASAICPQGKLRVTAPASFGRLHLIPALEAFMKRYPNLHVDLHLSDRIMDLVEGGFDLAIRDASLPETSFVARKLAPVRRILVAAPKYLQEYGEPAAPEDLKNHACINLMGLETWDFATSDGVLSIKTKNRFRTDNGEAARDACVNGIGITQISVWCCYQQLQRGELVQVMKDHPLVAHTAIWAVYPSSRLLAPKVRVFIDYFSEIFKGIPYWEEACL